MIETLSNEELLAAIRALVQKSGCIEADLLAHLPERPATALSMPPALAVSMQAEHSAPPPARRAQHEPAIQPLAEDADKIQFTASRAFREKLQQAPDLLRHRNPNGDLAAVFEAALDCLIQAVKKERFALGRKARPAAPTGLGAPGTTGLRATRHIPDPIKRAVYERDGGRCTFADERSRRSDETGALEFDHLDGFARTHSHSVERIRLPCRPHNRYAAEQMYGRTFMQGAQDSTPQRMLVAGTGASTRPGTSPQSSLF